MTKVLVYVLSILLFCNVLDAKELYLKQVFIFSRHNVRYPIADHLERYTRKPWPEISGPKGQLTPKGARLEGYMGEYFAKWFKDNVFLSAGCPDDDEVYVYANNVNRTMETARAFLDGAFKGCSVPVHYKNVEGRDPLFQPVIHNTTEAYKNMVIEEINRKILNSNPKLKDTYLELNDILEIKESDICNEDDICDLTEPKKEISYEVGQEVWVVGPLLIANSVVDFFVMSYYDGVPTKDIAWGQIRTKEKWRILTEIGRQDHVIRYKTVAKDIGKLLMEYLRQTFTNYDDKPKLTMLVGHDFNINAITTNMGFEPIDLPRQFEKFPIGGKLMFQRWSDGENDFLKVEYVYPSWSQLRSGRRYSTNNLPQKLVMKLSWCSYKKGLCPWNEFVSKV